MKDYMIEANEQFFMKLISALSEGGKWGWPNELEIFTKHDEKLEGSESAYNKVALIVSPEFLRKNFRNIKNNL